MSRARTSTGSTLVVPNQQQGAAAYRPSDLHLSGQKIGGCDTYRPATRPYRWRGIEGWSPEAGGRRV